MHIAAAQILFMKVADYAALDLAIHELKQEKNLRALLVLPMRCCENLPTKNKIFLARNNAKTNCPRVAVANVMQKTAKKAYEIASANMQAKIGN